MTQRLYEEDEDEDDEDNEDNEEKGEGSRVPCAQCEGEISFNEEVFLLRIVQAYYENGMLVHRDVEEDGEPRYEAAFFCFSCWEEEQESLEEFREDCPPVRDGNGLLACDLCESDILEEETVGLLLFGEVQKSERCPNGDATATFAAMSDGKHLCISCLHSLSNNRTNPLWPDDIEPAPGLDVCIEGISERCWRYGNCTCANRSK